MKAFKFFILFVLAALCFSSCQLSQQQRRYNAPPPPTMEEIDLEVSESILIPKDGSAPVAGIKPVENPDTIITFTDVGEKFEVKKGKNVNIIYDGIDPEMTYIVYESTFKGYNLELAYRDEQLIIGFSRLCQIYIVASPRLTTINVAEELKYEQIIWTPRADGSWEVRLGTTERGCSSKALYELHKLRSVEYEKRVRKK